LTKPTSNIYNKHVIDSLKIVIGNLRLGYMKKNITFLLL